MRQRASKTYYVYIIANVNHRVLYTGVTSNPARRISEHREGIFKGFSKKYNVNKLVYIEGTEDIMSAITREKEIKGWLRNKKIVLIESMNPTWEDLSPMLGL
ncbi:MAG: GIY-YIG nuclease family protein [Patescibacteria group bacterium]|nr:GIY-YIG nuclease family protein [Patescibacteria group bacterium]